MLSDIEIAQAAKMQPITEIAANLGLQGEDVIPYGHYKAKLNHKLAKADKPEGKLILVTAISPTPAGEGKTTTSVGLADAMNALGKKTMLCLREPSLGPVFGVKGGAAGGGYAQVVPMEDINLHFTGDLHAIGTANNLLAAMIDNSIQQGNPLNIDPRRITWKRCMDMNDRQLRFIVDGLGGKVNGKNVSFRTPLHSGDTVEILTASNQTPKPEWLRILVTSRARAKLRLSLKETRQKQGLYAKELLERRLKNKKLDYDEATVAHLIRKMGFKEQSDFYHQIAEGRLDPSRVLDEYQALVDQSQVKEREAESAENFEYAHPATTEAKKNDDVLIIDKSLKGIDFSLARCCHPIYGDKVFGFVTVNGGIKIHRADCPNAAEMQRRFGYRIVRAQWSGKGSSHYDITLRVIGNDDIGIVSNITNIISKDEKIVMRSINIDSHDGLFSGNLVVQLDDKSKLNLLIKKLRTVKGVKQVIRL